VVAAGAGEQLGVAWFLRDTTTGRIIRHGGATKGQQATLQILPDRRFAISVLTNSERGSELYQPLVRLALRLYLGVDERDPQPIAASPAQLEPYAGRYTAALDDVTLALRGDDLVMEVSPKGGFPTPDTPPSATPPPMRVALCGEDQVIVLDPPSQGARGEFLRGPDGAISWFRIGGRVHAAEETR
jgi:hypothetical protein